MRVAGIDSSTQSTKVLVVEDGVVIREGKAPHPDGTEVAPEAWWDALLKAIEAAGGIADCQAVSVAGQQHGLVCLDENGAVLRPALLWNDTRSATSAADLITEKSADFWVQASGSAPVASLTVSKVRWVADHEPDVVANLAAICLPHDWLTWKLSGSTDIHDLVTDRSDASGTGYVDCETGEYRYDLLAHALHWSEEAARGLVLPRIAEPFEQVGNVAAELGGAVLGPGCGDNAGASLGLGLSDGEISVSIGTSGVVAAVSKQPVRDPNAEVTGFMDATGNWLPLGCTLNGSRIVDYVKNLLRLSYEDMDHLALDNGPADITLIPFFEGERTPNLPFATAQVTGLTPETMTPGQFARAAFESIACLMRGALEALKRNGITPQRALLVGGGAKSPVLQALMPSILGVPVVVPEAGEYVALGAAWQAHKILDSELEPWPVNGTEVEPLPDGGAWARFKTEFDKSFADE